MKEGRAKLGFEDDQVFAARMLILSQIMALASSLVSPVTFQSSAKGDDAPPPCSADRDRGVCLLPDRSKATLMEDMRDSLVAYWGEGDTLYIAARGLPANLKLCCSVKATLHPVPQSDMQTLSVHFPGLQTKPFPIKLYSDENLIMDSMWSPKSGARQVDPQIEDRKIDIGTARYSLSIYTPRQFNPSRPYDIVYLADGQGLKAYVAPLDEMIESGQIRPTIVVGLWSNLLTRQKVFLYERNKDNTAFNEYLSHVVNDIVPDVERHISTMPPQRRIVAGFSNGADWALAAHAFHPSAFPAVIALSAVSSESVRIQPKKDVRGRYFVATGSQEDHAMQVHAQLYYYVSRTKAERCFSTPDSGHSDVMWTRQFIIALKWINGGKCIDS